MKWVFQSWYSERMASAVAPTAKRRAKRIRAPPRKDLIFFSMLDLCPLETSGIRAAALADGVHPAQALLEGGEHAELADDPTDGAAFCPPVHVDGCLARAATAFDRFWLRPGGLGSFGFGWFHVMTITLRRD
jgi:hypothetical protein